MPDSPAHRPTDRFTAGPPRTVRPNALGSAGAAIARTLPAFLLFALALALGGVRTAHATTAGVHPQDGPHVDLRIRLDDQRVRWSIGMNLAFMDEIVDVGREREDALDPVEEGYVIDAVAAVLTEENQVVVDGVTLTPTVTRFAFSRPDRTLLPLFPVSGMRGLIRAEIIIDYPLPADPRELTLTWARYPTDLLATQLEGGKIVPLAIEAQIQANGIIDLIRFSEPDPEVTWFVGAVSIADRMEPVPDPFDVASGVGAKPDSTPAAGAAASLAPDLPGDSAEPAARTPNGAGDSVAAVPTSEARPADGLADGPADGPADNSADNSAGSLDAEPVGGEAGVSTNRITPRLANGPRRTIPMLSVALIGFAALLLVTVPFVRRSGVSRVFTYGSILVLFGGAGFLWTPVQGSVILPWERTDGSALVASASPPASSGSVARPGSDQAIGVGDGRRTDGTAPNPSAPKPSAPGAAFSNPPASAPLAIAPPGLVPDAALLAVFEPTLTNVYRAFDYSEESDIYDALAFSVQGPLLGDLYDRIFRSLVMEDHDRAIARVTNVVLLDAAVRSRGPAAFDVIEDASPPSDVAVDGPLRRDDSFVVHARWQVDGTVVHWGHAHARRQVYVANFGLAPSDEGGWRIVDQRVFEQRRLPSPTDPLDMPAPGRLAPGDDL
ncbi:MAG: hypothetical protein AB8G96_04770 [Phycisphaerales bacterium]